MHIGTCTHRDTDIHSYFLTGLNSPLSHLKLHSKSSCDHFSNYFFATKFCQQSAQHCNRCFCFPTSGNLAGSVFFPHVKNKRNGTNVA